MGVYGCVLFLGPAGIRTPALIRLFSTLLIVVVEVNH